MFDFTEIRERYSNRSLLRELDWTRNYPPRGMSKLDTDFIRWLADAAYQRIKELEENESWKMERT